MNGKLHTIVFGFLFVLLIVGVAGKVRERMKKNAPTSETRISSHAPTPRVAQYVPPDIVLKPGETRIFHLRPLPPHPSRAEKAAAMAQAPWIVLPHYKGNTYEFADKSNSSQWCLVHFKDGVEITDRPRAEINFSHRPDGDGMDRVKIVGGHGTYLVRVGVSKAPSG
jgi:hypothetical protein